MADVKTRKIRAFLRRQHSELIVVKRRHIGSADAAIRAHVEALAHRINEWRVDGKLEPVHSHRSRTWMLLALASIAMVVKSAIVKSSAAATTLATGHAHRFAGFAESVFGDDSIVVDGHRRQTLNRQRAEELQLQFVGAARSSSGLNKLIAAVAAGVLLSELADSIGADSDKPKDIAERVLSPVASRAETYIRTETGSVYAKALADIFAGSKLRKRWATIDPGCNRICHSADGQVVDDDDVFEMGDGSTTDYPPAHPNCDCTWLPWRDEWGRLASTDDIEEQEAA